jgi:Arc/MetJ-type ribon-helix-helix transcriptional regulator
VSEQSIHRSANAEAHDSGMLEQGGYRNASEYIESPIREDLLTRQRLTGLVQSRRDRLELLAEEGLQSGPPIAVDSDYWEREKQLLKESLATNR